MNRKSTVAILIVIAMVGAGVVCVLVGMRSYATAEWPSVEGRVISASVDRAERMDQDTRRVTYRYTPVVRYSYSVDGQEYEGTKITYTQGQYRTESRAREDLEPYPVGGQVTVYYDPQNPKSLVLEPGGDPMLFVVAGLLVVVGVFFGVSLMRAPDKPKPGHDGPASAAKRAA